MDIHTPSEDVTLNSSLKGDALNMDIHTSREFFT